MNQIAKAAPPTAITQVNDLFKMHRKAIEDALPKHLTADRMMRIAMTELRKAPKLQQCDPLSFLGAVVQASQLGLEPGGALGHCYLVPYARECQLQLGYRGMVDLARRSGNIVSISAHCVYEGDTWELTYGTDEGLKHTPAFKSSNMTHVYAVAKLKDGGVQFDAMSRAEIEYIRDTYSQGFRNQPKTSPWTTAFDEMARKTIVRRMFKMLPTSIEIRDAIRIDEDDAQQNAKIIDANYEVQPLALDPAKMEALTQGQDAPLQTATAVAAMDADRKFALETFQRANAAYRKAGKDPEKILGKKINDILLSDAGSIMAAADVLSPSPI